MEPALVDSQYRVGRKLNNLNNNNKWASNNHFSLSIIAISIII